MLSFRQKLKLIGFAIGILTCYTTFGLVQEQIFRGRYGNETKDSIDGKPGEKFRAVISFGLMQSIFYTTFGKILVVATNQPKNESPQSLFALAAIFYVLGKVTSYLSLGYVPYPTQIIGKSSKPIPVMILGVLLGRKTYTLRKVILVLFIVAGVAMFIFKDEYTVKDGENPLLGNSLIAASLLFDGLLGATEDRMRSIAKPTAFNFMHYLNLWSTGFHILGVAVFGEGPKLIDFTARHPEIIKYFIIAVLVGCFGQIFISSMVSNFGALPLSITTTTRKFFSVFLSVIIYHNELTFRQWCAAFIIFGALFIDAIMSKKMTTNAVEPSKPNNELEEVEDKQKHETEFNESKFNVEQDKS